MSRWWLDWGYCLKIELVVCGLWKNERSQRTLQSLAQPLPEGMMVPFTEKGKTGEHRFGEIVRVVFWSSVFVLEILTISTLE